MSAHQIDTINTNPTFVTNSFKGAVLRLVNPGAEDRARARSLRDLARRVRLEREAFIAQALGIDRGDPAQLRFTNPNRASSGEVVDFLVRWYPVDGPAGTIAQVAEFYRHETEGRLVVLGGPGSGKTMLLSQLVRDLITAPRHPDGSASGDADDEGRVVPVMMGLSSCELGDTDGTPARVLAARMDAWIAARLEADYQIPGKTAAGLLADGHILPVLDGLDEMDLPRSADGAQAAPQVARPRAAAVVKALNHDRTRPVVLACRNLDYADLVRAPVETVPSGPRSPIVGHARHVTLQPLAAAEIAGYLAQRFPDPQALTSHTAAASKSAGAYVLDSGEVVGAGQVPLFAVEDRWRPVVDAIGDGHALLEVLASPLQLFLAVTAYAHPDTQPGDLVDLPAEQVRDHLFEALIPAVTRYDEHARRRGWTPKNVHDWLSQIAEHQTRQAARGGSLVDIHLPDLWRISGRRYPRLIPALLVLVLGLASAGYMAGGVRAGTWISGFLVVGTLLLAASAWSDSSPLNRADFGSLRSPGGRRKMLGRLQVNLTWGLMFGLLGGLIFWQTYGQAVGLVVGLVTGTSLWLAFSLHEWMKVSVDYAASTATLVRQCLAHYLAVTVLWGLAIGLGNALSLGLLVGVSTGLTFAVPAGLMFGLVAGVATGDGNVWLRYALGVRSAARQGRLPTRPAKFLDWCLTAGLTRMAGPSIQFRHRDLQHWLTTTAAIASDRRGAAPL